MKALQCLVCGDLVEDLGKPLTPRACLCGRHSIWTLDRIGNRVAVYDRKGTRNRACLVRISNDFLKYMAPTNASIIQRMIDGRQEITHFKEQHSLIVKTAIGTPADSVWADSLPIPAALSEAPVRRRQLLARLAVALWK
ncbi:MAG TPA: hypothetical protein VJ859_16315 [Allosphingosinicella sp.]|nr:hypothetical protein [Allosphingosinicella sp.]